VCQQEYYILTTPEHNMGFARTGPVVRTVRWASWPEYSVVAQPYPLVV